MSCIGKPCQCYFAVIARIACRVAGHVFHVMPVRVATSTRGVVSNHAGAGQPGSKQRHSVSHGVGTTCRVKPCQGAVASLKQACRHVSTLLNEGPCQTASQADSNQTVSNRCRNQTVSNRVGGWWAGWLVGRLAGWLVGRLVGLLVGRLVWLVGWLVGWLAGWLVGQSAGWLVGWLAGWLVGHLVGWLVGWLSRLVGWLIGHLVGWLVGGLVGWLVGRPAG